MINDLGKELNQNLELEVKIETNLHQALIGVDGKRVKKLQGKDTNQYTAEKYIAEKVILAISILDYS